MSARDFLNNNSSIVTILAVVVLVVALGVIVWNSRGPGSSRRTPDTYFYDLNTGKVFVERADNYPPIEVASGPTPRGNKAGVWARIFTCGECENYDGMTADEVAEAGGIIAYLEMFTPEMLEQMANPEGRTMSPLMMGPGGIGGGMLTKRPEDDSWIEKSSPEAMQIASLTSLCPGGRPKICQPGR